MKKEISGDQLKDFQRATVDYVFGRLTDTADPCERFLVADEVGLGKTLVARGIIQRFRDRWKELGRTSLNVIYICSNQSIASQNLDRLNIEKSDQPDYGRFSRINDLAVFDPAAHSRSFLRLTALSPNTSFNVSSGGGIVKERAILYEILRRHPDFKSRRAKLAALLRLDVSEHTWDRWLSGDLQVGGSIRKEIAARFSDELKETAFPHTALMQILSVPVNKVNTGQLRRVIGALRKQLAAVCVEYIRPDLIIMDEFQRFKSLISQDEHSEVRLITDRLFSSPGLRILLLSATPYKMYTLRSDEETGESHFEEFKFVVNFLLNNSEKASAFNDAWTGYSRALLQIGDRNFAYIKKEKAAVEGLLRKIIARTERVTASDDRNTLVRAVLPNTLNVSPGDIDGFIALDSVAKQLKNVNSPVEYCKSCPFPLSFMDGYQLQKLVRREIGAGNAAVRNALSGDGRCFVPAQPIDDYESLGSPNARLAYLFEHALHNGGADLLWVPPALPYYSFGSPFQEQPHYSKMLVFSSWVMVPKMIAALTSYECERLTHSTADDSQDDDAKAGRHYFSAAKDRSPRPRLRFTVDGTNFRTLSSYALMYPSIALSRCWRIGTELADREVLLNSLAAEISTLISSIDIGPYLAEEVKKADDRWALIWMLLLDREHHSVMLKRIQEQYWSFDWNWFWRADDDATGANEYYRKVFEEILFSDDPGQALKALNLGPPPDDMAMQLAHLALGSPAVCSLRSLEGYCGSGSETAHLPFYGAFRIADAFRKFYNIPEHIAVIDKQGFSGSYWQTLLQYSIAGNFQAMLDEFTDTLNDHFGLWDYQPDKKVTKLVALISENIGLRTVNVAGHTLDSFLSDDSPKHFRCHFGVALNQSFDTEKDVVRADAVRNAFNSPFRPFVLATTSIGQEGLDFHLYCRKILHWNLPANPVDFEQREGRINRFKNLAIRQNIALKYRAALSVVTGADLWPQLFAAAAETEKGDKSDLVPFWHVEPENIFIERHAPVIPYSKEMLKLRNLLKTISLYRLSLGQPRQEELMDFLLNEFTDQEIAQIQDELLINLSPYHFAGG